MTCKKHILLFNALFSFNAIFCMSKVKPIISGISTLLHHGIATGHSLALSYAYLSRYYGSNPQVNNFLSQCSEADESTKNFVKDSLNGHMPFDHVKINKVSLDTHLVGFGVTGKQGKTLIIPEHLFILPSLDDRTRLQGYIYNRELIANLNQKSIPEMINQQQKLQNRITLSEKEKQKLTEYTKNLKIVQNAIKHEAGHTNDKEALYKGIVALSTPLLGQYALHKLLPQCKKTNARKIGSALLLETLYIQMNMAYSRHLEYKADQRVTDAESFSSYLKTINKFEHEFNTQVLGIPEKSYYYSKTLSHILGTHPSTERRIARLQNAKISYLIDNQMHNPFA